VIRALDEMLDKIWLMVGPYMASLAAHFIIFCLTMFALVLMLAISWCVVLFCEKISKADPLVVRVLVGVSDLLTIGYFALYLGRGLV
jgi:hypothetical protein